MRRVTISITVFAAVALNATPAHAQFGIPQVVIDPKAIAEAVKIVQIAQRQLQLFQTISRVIPGLDKFSGVPRMTIDVSEASLDYVNRQRPLPDTHNVPAELRDELERSMRVIRRTDALGARASDVIYRSYEYLDAAAAVAEWLDDIFRDTTSMVGAQQQTAAAALLAARQQEAAMHLQRIQIEIQLQQLEEQRDVDAVIAQRRARTVAYVADMAARHDR